jgi:hypothetical protein
MASPDKKRKSKPINGGKPAEVRQLAAILKPVD